MIQLIRCRVTYNNIYFFKVFWKLRVKRHTRCGSGRPAWVFGLPFGAQRVDILGRTKLYGM